MVKIINTSRKRIDQWIADGYWKKDSLLGRIYADFLHGN